MKSLRIFPAVLALAAGLLVAAPAACFAGGRKVTVYRDHDGDGHYNKKSYSVNNHGYYGGGYHGGGYYGGSYYRGGYYGGARYGYYGRPCAPYGGGAYYGLGFAPLPFVSFNFTRSIRPASRVYVGNVAGTLSVDVQTQLQRRGFYRGQIDGDVGPGTRAAIRAYQDERGLAVTGRIDRSLLRALGIG